MKKLFALLIALALCLGLAACQSQTEDEKAYEAANALLEAGDYQGAIDAFYSIEMYINIEEKLYQAQTQLLREQIVPYVGTWMDLKSGTTVIVHPDGNFSVATEYGEQWESTAAVEGDTVWLLDGLTLQQRDGVTHLASENFDFVSEADHAVLGAREVEITLENWETYFEIRDAKHITRNDFGDVEYAFFSQGVFLKEEYAQKLYDKFESCSVTFKFSYDESFRHIEGDYPGGEFWLGEEYVDPWWEYEPREAVVSPWYQEYEGMEESDFYQKHGAEIPGFISEWDGKSAAVVPTNIAILDVTGTLKLYP